MSKAVVKGPSRTRGELWELRGSSIHNQGMFARKRIAAGTRIIEYLGQKVAKEESNERALAWEEQARERGEGMVYVFDLNEEFDLDGNIPDNPAKFINHSCEENCEAVNEDDRIYIYSLRDIEKDAELSFDYGYGLEHFLDHPCRCGSKGCVGYIVAKPERPKLKRLLASRQRRKRAEGATASSASTSTAAETKKSTTDARPKRKRGEKKAASQAKAGEA